MRINRIISGLVILCAIAIVPYFASAQSSPLVAGQTTQDSSGFTAPYTFNGTSKTATTFYAWIKPDGPGNAFIRQDMYLASIASGSFSATFNYASLGLVPGTLYDFYITNATSDPATTFAFGSFTVPGGTSSGGSGGAGTNSFKVNLTETASGVSEDDDGTFYASFDITPQSALSADTPVTLGIFNPTDLYHPVVVDPLTLPAGNLTTSPTVDQLPVAGAYAAVVYTGSGSTTVNVSPVVSFTITDPNAGGSSTPSSSGIDLSDGVFHLVVTSLVASDTGANFTVTLGSKSSTSLDADIGIYVETSDDTTNFTNKTAEVYSGAVGKDASHQFSVTGLNSGTTYKYQFQDSVTGDPIGGGTFMTTGTAGGIDAGGTQTTNPVNGSCGPANGQSYAVVSLVPAPLCATGNLDKSLSDPGPWTWNCLGLNQGTNATCSASSGAAAAATSNYLKNPLAPGLDTFPKIFAAIYNGIILPVAIPFIAIMIMYSGFLFVLARRTGNTFTLDRAKSTFKYTMIGAALLLGGFVIANALQGTLCQLVNNCPAVTTTTQ